MSTDLVTFVTAQGVDQKVSTAVAQASTVQAAAATAVSNAVSGQSLVKTTDPGAPQVSPEAGLGIALVDANGYRTWLEATDTDGGPTSYAAQKIAAAAGPAVMATSGLSQDTVGQPGISVMLTDSAGTATWLQATDTDGGPTPYATQAVATALAGADQPRATLRGRRNWELALTDRDTRVLTWLWMGASTTQGLTGQEFDKHVTQVEKMLQSSYNPGGVQGGFTNKVRGSFTGQFTEILHGDLKQLVGMTAGQVISYTATKQQATGLELQYLEGPSYAPFTVTIDGTSYTITPDTTGADDRASGLWRSPAFTRRFPVITITASGKASLGNFRLEDGDRTLGLRVYNGALAGSSTTKFIDDTYAASWWQRFTALQPDVMPIQLGTNDINDGNSVAVYTANMQAIITKAKSLTTRRLWMPLIAQQSTQPEFPNYIAAMQTVAAANPDVCTFHSYYDYFPRTAAEYAADTTGVMQSDQTHPTNLGAKYIGQILARALGLPSLVTWPMA